ncbi:ferredoxin [Synechococcus sp. PCC 7502]|uniref:2Fe-2S iron-sulfur cluster-binding protein n=1 Tax=Synechococcus sp. PCC 7502 TaxID=1173263 RepID=UPI00029FC469|nr:2Fe-2S iron-sulfur cluster-binding protein [Synechococcus sp. PCC 7502]AFY73224.1 ferredoxin [Synechococcus sp. PCC 7502]
MKYKVQIHNRQNQTIFETEVDGDRYILDDLESQGVDLPSACISGACTTCAVRVKSGTIYQPNAIGLSQKLRDQGYALICSGYAESDLVLETQDENEVYYLQFGQYFDKQVRRRFWFSFPPLDQD